MTSMQSIAATAYGPLCRMFRRIASYRYAIAAADQVAISLFNFGLSFVLVRLLSATEFGTFGLWIAVANLAIIVQSALVCTPLSVHAPIARDEGERHRLEEALGSVNFLLAVFVVVAVVAVNRVSGAEW